MTMHPPAIPLTEQIAELEVELAFRRRRWPTKISTGAFTPEHARRIDVLEAALNTLKGKQPAPSANQPAEQAKEGGAWPNR